MAMTLSECPDLPGFYTDGCSEPLRKTAKIFHFKITKFLIEHNVDRYETYKGETKYETSSRNRIILDLRSSDALSFIGSDSVFFDISLILHSLDHPLSEGNTPHLKMYFNDDAIIGTKSVILYLEENELEDIRRRLINGEVNSGNFSFTTSFDYDFAFTAKNFESRVFEGKHVSYPTKILQSNFFDYCDGIKPYRKQPVELYSYSLNLSIPPENLLDPPKEDEDLLKSFFCTWMTEGIYD